MAADPDDPIGEFLKLVARLVARRHLERVDLPAEQRAPQDQAKRPSNRSRHDDGPHRDSTSPGDEQGDPR